MRHRFMEANQAVTSAMLAAKSKGLPNDEVWNHVQPFYAKKFGLLFGTGGNMKALSTMCTCTGRK